MNFYGRPNKNLNVIQRHADDFLRVSDTITLYSYKDFIVEVRNTLYEYHKESHRIQFVEHLILRFKQEYDNHEEICTYSPKENCPEKIIYENVIFFLQEEIEELESKLDESYMNEPYRSSMEKTLNEIIEKLERLELGQKITYDDLFEEMQDLKTFYYLNKKNWKELFIGKLSTMIAGGVISETISKEIVDIIRNNYPNLIQ